MFPCIPQWSFGRLPQVHVGFDRRLQWQVLDIFFAINMVGLGNFIVNHGDFQRNDM